MEITLGNWKLALRISRSEHSDSGSGIDAVEYKHLISRRHAEEFLEMNKSNIDTVL